MKRGASHVASLYTFPAASTTQVLTGAQAVFNLGLRSIKMYLTPSYATADYTFETWSSAPANLTQLVQTTEYTGVLAINWDTVFFTTFDFSNPNNNWWHTDPSNTRLANMYTEVYNLCVHLLTTYAGSGKTFVIQNWEGDWSFMDSFTETTFTERRKVDNYLAFLATRQKAVNDAKAATAHTGVTVLHAIECNRVLDARLYADRRRIITDMASRLQPDVISYSAYDSTIATRGFGTSHAQWEAWTEEDFTKAIRVIKRAFPGVPVVIGEISFFDEEAPGTADLADMVQVSNDIAVREGCSHYLYWEIFSNDFSATSPSGTRGTWLIRPDGSEAPAAVKLRELGPGS